MAFYAEEEEVWKCQKHPSRRRRTGICPTCLRDRLLKLCPDCSNVRPCACCSAASTATSSSSTFLSGTGVGSVGRISKLLDREPAFRRSRSTAVAFLRSRFGDSGGGGGGGGRGGGDIAEAAVRSSSFWSSVFKSQKAKKKEGDRRKNKEVSEEESVRRWRMMRSRSVGVAAVADASAGEVRSKNRGWSFPSPITVFRQPKSCKVIQERSLLYSRG